MPEEEKPRHPEQFPAATERGADLSSTGHFTNVMCRRKRLKSKRNG
jgi:hypothetical protein